MPYSILKIATLVGAARYGTHEADIDTLLTDSRSLAFPETTLFFALRTAVGDGHLYIPKQNYVLKKYNWDEVVKKTVEKYKK